MIYVNGDIYVGEWKSDKKEGLGKLTKTDSTTMEGDWKNDELVKGWTCECDVKVDIQDGINSYIYKNGNKYNGEFKNKMRNGKGTMKYLNGDVYNGDWVDNKRQGSGKLTTRNGTEYIG